jgi:hypothetical protein
LSGKASNRNGEDEAAGHDEVGWDGSGRALEKNRGSEGARGKVEIGGKNKGSSKR